MKKSTLITMAFFASLCLWQCKKSNEQPQAQKTTSVQQIQSNNKVTDTTMTGEYQMVASSISSELNTTIKLRLYYSSQYIDYSTSDTMNYYVWLRIVDNMNFTAGYTKVSNTVTFNDALTQNDAKIDVHNKNITTGFYGDQNLSLYPGSKFSGDTLVLNFSIKPISGPAYSLVTKYKKI